MYDALEQELASLAPDFQSSDSVLAFRELCDSAVVASVSPCAAQSAVPSQSAEYPLLTLLCGMTGILCRNPWRLFAGSFRP